MPSIDIVPPIVREPFPPGRSSRCFCGSGLRFKNCCGQSGMVQGRKPPSGIGVVEEFIAAEACAEVCEFARSSPAEWLEVVDMQRSTQENVVRIRDERRKTERVDVKAIQERLNGWIQRALTDVIEPDLERPFDWFELPQLLKYTAGGLYDSHADSDSFDTRDGRWKKTLDRDISLLIYLNNEYEGGSLLFEHFDFTIQPRAGMLVYFPSDMRYQHEARPVTSGLRFALVSWARLADEPRVLANAPRDVVQVHPAKD